MKKVNVGLRGSAAGRGHDYEEKYVARKPISPSKDHRKEDTKEYKVSEPSTLHLARPSVVCCGSSAPHNRANFDHEMVLMSAGWNQHKVSSQTSPSARGPSSSMEPVRGRNQQGKKYLIHL